MSYIAERMSKIDASGIRKVFALADKMENPINLSIGQPDYDVDEICKEVAINAIKSGFNSYTQTWGIEELREAVQEYYQTKFGAKVSNVMITCGVTGGLFLALLATVNPEDEVILMDPYFVMYKHLINLLGGKPVLIDTYPDFHLTADKIESAITEKTKILMLNSPSNPTGTVISEEDLTKIAELAKKHKLLVITDEIYEALLYEGKPCTIAGKYDQVLLLNGFSKNAGMTGWRIGYAAGPEDIIQQMNTLQQYTFVCAPSFAQKAAVQALKADMTEKVNAYRKKRDLIYEGLKDTFNVVKPRGAFYIFPEVPGGDGDEFVKKAIENNILIIPGSVFSERKTHIRISYAATDETIKRGVEALNKLAKQFQ